MYTAPCTQILFLQAVSAIPQQKPAMDFAYHIVSACIVREPILAASDLLNTLDALSKLARTLPQAGQQQLQGLIEQARRPRYINFLTHSNRVGASEQARL